MTLSLVAKKEKIVEKADGPYEALLPELLEKLQWKGEARHLVEALPVDNATLTLQRFRDVMAVLGFDSVLRFGSPARLKYIAYPALWIDANGHPHLVRSAQEANEIDAKAVTHVVFHTAEKKTIKSDPVNVATVLKRFHALLAQVLFVSLVVGFLALAPTLYNMALYDTIIPAGSTKGLPMLFAGVALAFVAECVLRSVRNKRLGYFGARMDHYVSCSVFERLLFLPPAYTERAAVSSQLARLRDFESVREFFTGPLATLFFELPLVAIYLTAMACIAGSLAFVPVVLVVAYGILLLGMDGRLKESARASANAISKRHEFLLEMLTKLRAIRLAGWEKMWQERYRQLSADASLASFHASMDAQRVEITSYVLMTLGGIATLGFGVVAVIDQHLTVGALIASMMLIWRIVAPMQLCCASITRIQQLDSSTKQVQRLLSLVPEHEADAPSLPALKLKGQITFHRVSLRYSAESEPALLGVSFNVKPGQIISVKGDNGSGKSSILKLILGLYTPQSGSVRLDGIDVRQFDPLDLRQAIAYVPQDMEVLPGTVRDNLLFANPLASDEACYDALRKSCALEEVERLPKGLDTVIAGENSEGISFMLTHRLNLARAYLKSAAIILFDEASHSLGRENDLAFAQMIAELRGKCTVILATHREDHMRLADQLLVMNKGELTHAGPPAQVLNVLNGRRS